MAGLGAGFFAAGFEGFAACETLPALEFAAGAGFPFACADLGAGAFAGVLTGGLAGAFAGGLVAALAGGLTGGLAGAFAWGFAAAFAGAFLGAGFAWGAGFLA